MQSSVKCLVLWEKALSSNIFRSVMTPMNEGFLLWLPLRWGQHYISRTSLFALCLGAYDNILSPDKLKLTWQNGHIWLFLLFGFSLHISEGPSWRFDIRNPPSLHSMSDLLPPTALNQDLLMDVCFVCAVRISHLEYIQDLKALITRLVSLLSASSLLF